MSLTPVHRAQRIFARLTALSIVAVAVPVLIASAAPASAGPGSTPADPIVLASLADVPAGATATGTTTEACATTSTFTTTKPAVAETTRTEYRYSRAIPAVAQVDHKVYAYTKTTPAVAEVKEYTFDKQVRRQKSRWVGTRYDNAISYGYAGSYDWRDAGYPNVTNTTGVLPSAPVPERGEFIHHNGGEWYFALFYQYVKISERVITTAQPAKTESSGERTTTLPAPWVMLSGYPKTVVDSPAVPGYTEYYVAGAVPSRDRAAASWITDASLKGWTRFEDRTVGNGDAQPAVVTYYSFNDGVVCATPTPTPEPPVVTPTPETPVVTPPATPTTEVLGEQAGRATGRLKTSCQGTVRVSMKNGTSSSAIYKIKVGKKVTTKKVKAESKKNWTTKGKGRSMATLMLDNRVLAKKRIPTACARPDVLPETGKRQ